MKVETEKEKETMRGNILEEEKVLKKIFVEFKNKNSMIIEKLKKLEIKNVLILATGSSMNAAQLGKYFLENLLDINIDIKEPFNYYNYEKVNKNLDLVIAISQSGKSASTIYALEYVKNSSDVKTLVVTSNSESPIRKYADMVLNLNFGIEQVGFVTKGFSATVLNLFLLAVSVGAEKSLISRNEEKIYLVEIEDIIKAIPQAINATDIYLLENREDFKKAARFNAVGYGSCYGTVKEFETKFTETVRCPSQGFELEAYMHGPYLEADKSHVLFYLDNEGKLSERLKALKDYMNPYVGKSVIIGLNHGDINIKVGKKLNEHLAALLLVIPIQLMSCTIAEFKGINLGIKIFKDFDAILKSKI
ncbi:SIS domain-containing protein [uncultured Fusobacterium sp.]|uniref:SIS domain-containing protein n=1 Tax=uncultured Fusobacterium sp. TaxID=159267 RepID=UPI002593D381|nr:SIS domain-containing protein [uncultured Fusobacterium sp.]